MNSAKNAPLRRSARLAGSKPTYGFLGLSSMNSIFARKCLEAEHPVYVWNRTQKKCREFQTMGARTSPTPRHLIDKVSIAFSCLSDAASVKQIVSGRCGIKTAYGVHGMAKGYVEMTGIDPETSKQQWRTLAQCGVRYVEAMFMGSQGQAEDGGLVIVAAGNWYLFLECQPFFRLIKADVLYVGEEVGRATTMYVVKQTISSTLLAGLSEGLLIAQRSGLKMEDFMRMLELSNLVSPFVLAKSRAMVANDSKLQHRLKNVRKDLKMALNMSDKRGISMVLTAQLFQLITQATSLGNGDEDSTIIFKHIKDEE